MAVLKIKPTGSFVTAVGKVFDGSSWVGDMKFYDGSSWIDLFLGLCTAGASSMPNLSDEQTEPTTTEVGARWNSSTGAVEWFEDENRSWQDTLDDWIGSCANTEYDGRWVLISGGSINSATPAEGVWQQMSLGDVFVDMSEQDEGTYDATVEFQLRRRSDGTPILTDQFPLQLVINPP